MAMAGDNGGGTTIAETTTTSLLSSSSPPPPSLPPRPVSSKSSSSPTPPPAPTEAKPNPFRFETPDSVVALHQVKTSEGLIPTHFEVQEDPIPVETNDYPIPVSTEEKHPFHYQYSDAPIPIEQEDPIAVEHEREYHSDNNNNDDDGYYEYEDDDYDDDDEHRDGYRLPSLAYSSRTANTTKLPTPIDTQPNFNPRTFSTTSNNNTHSSHSSHPTSPTTTSIYTTPTSPPPDHITLIHTSTHTPAPRTLSKPSWGTDVPPPRLHHHHFNPLTLLSTLPATLYSTLRGTSAIWDRLLATIPDLDLASPCLDVGCARGKVLLKLAARKRKLAEAAGGSYPVQPAYGVDEGFGGAVTVTRSATMTDADGADGAGGWGGGGGGGGGGGSGGSGTTVLANASPAATATYQNAKALGLLDHVVLHTASYAKLPFADDTFAVVTSNLALHRLDPGAGTGDAGCGDSASDAAAAAAAADARRAAAAEIARVCAPGGWVIVMDFEACIGDVMRELRGRGWSHVDSEVAGMKAVYWTRPCSVLRARKPPRRDWVRRNTDWSIMAPP